MDHRLYLLLSRHNLEKETPGLYFPYRLFWFIREQLLVYMALTCFTNLSFFFFFLFCLFLRYKGKDREKAGEVLGRWGARYDEGQSKHILGK
ncbi:hypothetical protein GDO81_018446 [Engystomops pustulosus]|uniref:Uncharacterized protein n=1 Tax=Engystomops pustulosus TaxID=76066 RepID=A0AAV6ZYC4_ENGPU|nr:hypothetical protein GDO81_018446 [Engystomops pustulosus]